jgi:hypothetical protein
VRFIAKILRRGIIYSLRNRVKFGYRDNTKNMSLEMLGVKYENSQEQNTQTQLPLSRARVAWLARTQLSCASAASSKAGHAEAGALRRRRLLAVAVDVLAAVFFSRQKLNRIGPHTTKVTHTRHKQRRR